MAKKFLHGKRKVGEEEGEIPQPSRATKTPRRDDPPPPSVVGFARTPKELAGFATRNEPGEREVYERRVSPEPQERIRRTKRLAGNYEGCRPAVLCVGPLNHSSVVTPIINNLPDPRVGGMFEDNVLAAAQAIVTSSQSDLDHYITSGGRYERDWLQRDIKANLVRTLVVVDVQQRMFMDMEQTMHDRNRDVMEPILGMIVGFCCIHYCDSGFVVFLP